MQLTPTELHYYKRELIAIELRKELSKFRQSPDIAALLSDSPSSSSSDPPYPFLRYLARHFVVDFPLLKRGNSSAEFWQKCQTFLDELSHVKLNTYTPQKRQTSQRRILLFKLLKLMTVTMNSMVRTVQGAERPINVLGGPNKDNEEDAELIRMIEQSMTLLENEDHYVKWVGQNGLNINVVTVRDVTEKRTLRQVSHAEFIVRTVLPDQKTATYVARRLGDFRRLYRDLKAEFPSVDIPSVPSKASDPSFTENSNNNEEKEEGRNRHHYFHRHRSSSDLAGKAHLYREKDRLLLRSFLRRVAMEPKLASSLTFEKFLTSDPVELTEAQVADAERRKQMDEARAKEESKFRDEVDQKMSELNELLTMLKKQILQPGGLLEVFEIIKTTERIEDLPEPLRKAFEWGRINFAYVLYTQFVSSDRAPENIAHLKRTHSLMPYRAVAQLLKVSNPFSMVKGVLDLFLAQPFGHRSLFQRIMLVNMNDEMKDLQQDIVELENQIHELELCQKLKNAVETAVPEEEEEEDYYVSRGKRSSKGEILEVLKNPDIEPSLTPDQIVKVVAAASHNEDNDDDNNNLIKQLDRLWTLYAKKREHELMMGLVFQGVTGDLLREIFAIFYQPLAQVYKAANLGESIQHLAAFIDDLIALLDSLDAENNTAQPFVELVQRHEQQFYTFVHNVHANDTSHLFDELLQYMDKVFSLFAHGSNTAERIDLAQVTVAAGVDSPEKQALLKKDIEALCAYHWRRKTQHMKRRRQKLVLGGAGEAADAVEKEALDFLPNGSEMMGLVNDLAEMEDDDDTSDMEETVAHEMTIEMPELKILPTVVPEFVRQVSQRVQ